MSNDVPEDYMDPAYLKKAFKTFRKRLRLTGQAKKRTGTTRVSDPRENFK